MRRVLNELAEEFNKEAMISVLITLSTRPRKSRTPLWTWAARFAGSLLAVAVLLIFLRNWRTILVIGLTIPIAIIAAFALLYFAGLSVNLMTLGALALAAGMLVDNAIVVSENIYRHLQLGSDSFKASVEGSNEVSGYLCLT